jgi:membrane protease YdiL (CAAX protease family)
MSTEKKKTLSVVVIIAWVILFALLWLLSILPIRNVPTFSVYFVNFYMIVVSIGVIRFVEKQSVIERLGVQSWRYLALALLSFVSLVAVYFSRILNPTAFTPIFLAPVSEEIFFRGYMLGRFRNEETLNSRWQFAYLFFVSVAFALSHIFIYGISGVIIGIFCMGAVYGIVYWFIGSILASVSIHTIYNFVVTAGAYWTSLDFWIWIFLITLPLIVVILQELLKRRKKEEKMLIAKSY